jgi:hypothetical protein
MAAQRRGTLTKVLAELSEEEMAALLIGMRAIHAARNRVMATEAATPAPPEGPAEPTG